MIALPAPERLATLVSSVTQTMLGISFRPDAATRAGPPLDWRTAVLPIPGARPITVGLSSDPSGCAALSAALFSVAAEEVDDTMIRDSLCELLNMTAGLLKSMLALDQALGLPRMLAAAGEPGFAGSQAVVLRAERLGLVLWVTEGAL